VVARLVAVVAKWSPSGSQWLPSGRQVVASRELSFHKNKNYVRKVRYVWQIQDLADEPLNATPIIWGALT